jgi:hypothetical protein
MLRTDCEKDAQNRCKCKTCGTPFCHAVDGVEKARKVDGHYSLLDDMFCSSCWDKARGQARITAYYNSKERK